MDFPIAVRMPYGGGVRAPELHDDSPEAYYVHTPGIKVAIPSTPADAKGLLAAAIRDPDPVVILEPKLLYRSPRGEVPEGEHVVPLGKARIARHGRRRDADRLRRDGARRRGAPTASTAQSRCSTCARLKPLDEDALLASVGRTGRAVIVQEAPRIARLRGRGRGRPRREGDPRPARAGAARDAATTSRSRTGRSRTPTCRSPARVVDAIDRLMAF